MPSLDRQSLPEFWAGRTRIRPARPPMSSEAQRLEAPITRLSADGADGRQIADAAVSSWRSIEAALAPVIGQRGVAALFARSLYVVRGEHPWLHAAQETAPEANVLAALQTALGRHSGPDAAAAIGAQLKAFFELLIRLIGASLTERLLHPVSDPSSRGGAVSDATEDRMT